MPSGFVGRHFLFTFALEMKRIAYIVIIVGTLLGCGVRQEYREALSRAEAVMNDHPDSALMILDSLGQHEKEFGRHFRMQYLLHRTNAKNKTDVLFTSDSLAKELVKHFDRHGTTNERVLAHYLLGRAYYDHGEAPMALQCYQNAAECADTLSPDCDYSQLSRVYAQMAQIFYEQGLYRQQLRYDELSVKEAWQGKDTLAALMSYEQENLAYLNLNLPDSLLYICEHASQLYRKYGYTHQAARVLFYTLRTLVHCKEFDKARNNMQIYESESEYFDSLRNIQKGREIYYKIKGLYFLHTNVLDSAEYYFRKELRDGKDFNNQNAGAKGLAELYQRLHLPDSVAKYSLYAYTMNDSLIAQRTTKEVERTQAMYDYTRHQRIAHQESQNAARANIRLIISIVVLLIVLLAASWLYIARRKVIDSLEQTALELSQIRTENLTLKQDAHANQQEISKNEKRIRQLEKKLGKYGKLVFFGSEMINNNLKQSPNYQQIEESAYKGQRLSESDWDTVCNLANEYYPGFYDYLLSNMKVGTIEYQICLLLRLHFKAGEIANMLGVTPPYISKISTEILGNLYGKKGSSKDLSKELCKIN